MNPAYKACFLALSCVAVQSLRAQMRYTLTYTDSSAQVVRVTIEPAAPLLTPVVFIMPRSVPGNYGVTKYDAFVGQLTAHGIDGSTSFASWPMFSTLRPSATPARGTLEFPATDYYALADGQTYLGPRFRVREYPGPVPLFVADYTEGATGYLDDYAWEETTSMKILNAYFGDIPFPYYTVLFRETIPAPGDDQGNFGFLHHMALAYIPLRCYGDTYHPYVLEIPPVIHNIWFNEGFMWYIVYDTLKQADLLRYFKHAAYDGPAEIRRMTLTQLSETASTQYAEDFRLGKAVFARGA